MSLPSDPVGGGSKNSSWREITGFGFLVLSMLLAAALGYLIATGQVGPWLPEDSSEPSAQMTAPPSGSGLPGAPATNTPAPTPSPRTPTPAPHASAATSPTPGSALPVWRTKIEIVWPHEGLSARQSYLANVTAYLIAEGSMDPPPCSALPVVRLWQADGIDPMRPVGVGARRLMTTAGRTFPVWDFNDIDIGLAREAANRIHFFVTVDGALTRHNVWTHATDARTVFPQADIPLDTFAEQLGAVDARIEIVWPQNDAPVDRANLANITAYLFVPGTRRALSADSTWQPMVRLHWTQNTDPESGDGVLGTPRAVTTEGGIRFRAWDFNDIDVSSARDSLNKLYFWITVDGVTTYSNIWSHGASAPTIFPQSDVLNSCK
jgi:hypothetical protein